MVRQVYIDDIFKIEIKILQIDPHLIIRTIGRPFIRPLKKILLTH